MSITISEDDFRDQWGARAQDSGDLFEHSQVVNLPLNTVWTVVECDDNNWYALPGFKIVNKLGYVVTDKAWEDDTVQAIWFLDDLEDEDEDEDEDGEHNPVDADDN
ncbi:MAG: hypothetical protein A2580_09195 [Hydrogenophilales bacterium RIFOXYD1_FULL_62_11]|nr:MAG: hypothetical protein A2580_09195 [Hydrogenophilales bacterium RIFOXYD1_FULL_62_11]